MSLKHLKLIIREWKVATYPGFVPIVNSLSHNEKHRNQ